MERGTLFGKLRALLDPKIEDLDIQPSLLSLSHQRSCTVTITSTCSSFLLLSCKTFKHKRIPEVDPTACVLHKRAAEPSLNSITYIL